MSGAHMVTEDLKIHQMWFLLSKSLKLQKEFSHLDIALAIRSLILPIKVVILHITMTILPLFLCCNSHKLEFWTCINSSVLNQISVILKAMTLLSSRHPLDWLSDQCWQESFVDAFCPFWNFPSLTSRGKWKGRIESIFQIFKAPNKNVQKGRFFSDIKRELYNQDSFIFLIRGFSMAGTLLGTREEKKKWIHGTCLEGHVKICEEGQIYKQCSIWSKY